MTTSLRQRYGLLIGILLIAATLRVTFTGASPLLDTLRDTFGLTTAETGIITTLPLIAFALVSPLAAGIARRFGMERSLLMAMIIICLGIALRSGGSAGLLYLGTALIGCGIALGNVLLPSLLKRDFAGSVAKLTSAYSITMGVAAAFGSLMVIPLAQWGLGWRGALLALMVFPLVALLCWLPQMARHQSASLSSDGALHDGKVWRSSLAWQVTLFMGLNSLVYYVVVAWLPAILVSHGYSEAQAGYLHGLLQLATAIPGLVIGLVLSRLKDQRGIGATSALIGAVSLVGLWLVPDMASIWVTLYGFSSGATMILGLTFIGLRASSAHQAAALSGMAQCVGYLLAAFGPPLMGRIHDINHNWALPLICCGLISLVIACFGFYAGRDRELGRATTVEGIKQPARG